MSKDLQALFGLKWNPFLPELPSEALFISPRIEHFGFRLEGKVREGGFALVTGKCLGICHAISLLLD